MGSLTSLIARNILQALKDFAYGVNAGHAIKHARTHPARQPAAEVTQHLAAREGPEEVPVLTPRSSAA